jgi:hypothetical protein
MLDTRRLPVVRWTVDYGDGSRPSEVILPHAWRQDVAVTYEGPVSYRTQIGVPRGNPHLLFHGVSYQAEVYLDGELALRHEGLWDAFAVPLSAYAGKGVDVEVRVTKNGGSTFPVRDVASGFLPYVYHTFGGMHGMVELLHDRPVLDHGPAKPRAVVQGRRLIVDGSPFYLRGLLHWGWYPELGHTNPPDDLIRQEVREARELGFNTVKFCLWVPSHRYLEILAQEEMFAWMELPLWDPSADPDRQEAMAEELERIVRQYRHHDNILVWTVGCELSTSTPAAYRERLTNLVRNLTGSPLVKDNSGGAEMYGGDLREFGDFYDYHPYCDTPFYPAVLDSLMPGPRREMPILLGEFNDIDVHRDLARIGDELPYWASNLPELNDPGVRWQYDLPKVLDHSRFATQPTRSRHAVLMESSRGKALFMRKWVHEAVRARDPIAGYAITGWRDTPISSSGMFDDWGAARYTADECAAWNGDEVLFLIPNRRPPWVDGGNRVGWVDPLNHFVGQVFLRVGMHAREEAEVGLTWRIVDEGGATVASGAEPRVKLASLTATEIGEIDWSATTPGSYRLEVEAGSARNEWPLWVVLAWDPSELDGWSVHDPAGHFGTLPKRDGDRILATAMPPDGSGPALVFLTAEGTVRMPFWREAAYEFHDDAFWEGVPFAERWERLLAISGDAALMPEFAKGEILMNRVDTRTYAEHPVLVRQGDRIVTTLRPFGGLGVQPPSLARNPAGVALLRALMAAV